PRTLRSSSCSSASSPAHPKPTRPLDHSAKAADRLYTVKCEEPQNVSTSLAEKLDEAATKYERTDAAKAGDLDGEMHGR
ncbi:type VII secretion target, partial [Mycolicibacterium smegmatis]|uniref:type VII secretion target n=1 Tax=Mycolicibacterium smegmatis TaxID=1772 RepID=UPI0023DBFEDE